MFVFISWAYTDLAKKEEEHRAAWVQSLLNEDAEANQENTDKLTTKHCLPEYYNLQQVAVEGEDDPSQAMDSLNANLLSVRFVIPSLEKVVTYQLAKRLPGSNKLAVSLACRSFLLNTFKGEWTGSPTKEDDSRLTFVGLRGLSDFLGDLALACAALGEPLPVDLWHKPSALELPFDDKMRVLVDACAANQKGEHNQGKYQDLILGWMGTGASAERDSGIALAAGFRLGLKGT